MSKKHSFPNVLIEILDALFGELETNLTGWFGKKKRSRDLIGEIRSRLKSLQTRADRQDTEVREAELREVKDGLNVSAKAGAYGIGLGADADLSELSRVETERKYLLNQDKIRELDGLLPLLKKQIREFFDLSAGVEAVYLQVDDFYHLAREDQPLVMDYIHRLCKDLPLYFKVATLRHVSTLYADRHGQPLGAQERHDYWPAPQFPRTHK